MSAWIVSREHVRFLVEAAFEVPRMGSMRHGSPLTWYHNGRRCELGFERERHAEVGQMLWTENVKSVAFRYPDDRFKGCLPGPIGEDYLYQEHKTIHAALSLVAVLKAIDCYEYQSCEHDGWKVSEAHAFCTALRHAVCAALPGYDDAPWGIDDAEKVA
jgi:hypothetical protein